MIEGETREQAGGRGEEEGGESDQRVDLTLIRWMLTLSPSERLAWCQAQADAIRRLRALRSRAE
mgnify:CR=1 FL=1